MHKSLKKSLKAILAILSKYGEEIEISFSYLALTCQTDPVLTGNPYLTPFVS